MKKLERSLGLTSVVAIGLSVSLGTGIFAVPGLAAAQTGPSIWLAYLIAGLCVIPAALGKAELATAMPASGGTYVYLYRAFGPLAGTIAGLGLWLSLLLKSSFALVAFGAYFVVFGDFPRVPTALALLVAVTVLNIIGIGKVSKSQILAITISVGGLCAIVAVGAPKFDPSRLTPMLTHGSSGLIEATAFVFFSYAGVTKVAALAEEVQQPNKNLPRGIILTLFIAIVLYGLVNVAIVGIVPMGELKNSLRPIYLLADTIGGRPMGLAAAGLCVLTMTAMATAGLLASSRFPFAMSRHNILPSALAQVSSRFNTPHISILLTALCMGLAIVFLDPGKIAKLASSFKLLIFIVTNLAVIVLRETKVAWYKPSYRAPLYPGLQIFGIVSGVGLLLFLGFLPAIGALVIAALGTILYFGYSRNRTDHLGVVEKVGPRSDLMRPTEEPFVEVQDVNTNDAAVVVALFGKERSPETLVEMGGALASGRRIHATHVTEIEPEIELESMLEEGAEVQSLRRRIEGLAADADMDLHFHAIASHDLVQTVHAVAARVHCEWLVMQWHGRPRRSLTSLSPIGWLLNHLPANLAMVRDQGVRVVREILVVPTPGPHDALVIRTADELAASWNAKLTLARFVHDDAPENAAESETDYLQQLSLLCSGPTSSKIVRGTSEVRAFTNATANYDLLVMAAARFTLYNAIFGSIPDRVTAQAACSVLMLKAARGKIHEAYVRSTASNPGERPPLVHYIEPGTVGAQLKLAQKTDVFTHLAQRFSDVVGNVGVKEISDAFWEREKTQNTAVGRGVALPHATINALDRSLLGVFVTEKPIDYQTPDGTPVDIFFATMGPSSERETHLELLSGIARLTLKTDLLKQVRSATTEDEMLRAIEACSRQVTKSQGQRRPSNADRSDD